uniref:Uncharacterized protein n=1 Tax=Arundo donax TaxID=35708 RepID=A0A0A9A242_ARUDO
MLSKHVLASSTRPYPSTGPSATCSSSCCQTRRRQHVCFVKPWCSALRRTASCSSLGHDALTPRPAPFSTASTSPWMGSQRMPGSELRP